MPVPGNSAGVPDGATSAGRPGVAIKAEEPEVPTEKPGGAPLKIEPPQGGPPTKKQRVLKLLQSEEKEPVEEREAGHLEELMNRIKKAAKAKLLYCEDATNSATVHFWCLQAISVLKADTSADAGKVTPSMVKQHLPVLILKVLYSNHSYTCLKHFVKIFDDLKAVGASEPVDLASLKKIAEADLLGGTVPEVAGDLGAKMDFFGSQLYKHFLELRVGALATAARECTVAEKRNALLQTFYGAAQSMDDLGKRDAFLQSAGWARSMMDTSVPPVARVAFAFEADTAKRIAYAASFAKLQNPEHSAGPPEVKEGASAAAVPGLTANAPGTKAYDDVNWSALMCFAAVTEVPRDLEWPAFREVLQLVANAGVRKKVHNPNLAGLLDFWVDVQTHFGHEAWAEDLLSAAAKARLRADHWPEVAFGAENLGITTDLAGGTILLAVVKLLDKLFKFRVPEFLSAMREKAVGYKKVPAADNLPAPTAAAPGGRRLRRCVRQIRPVTRKLR